MTEYHGKPDFENMKIDFSEFHALDHSMFGSCDDRRRHWRYYREFKLSPALHSWTTCRIGIHQEGQMHGRDGIDSDAWWTCTVCGHCGKELSERQPE